MATIEKGKHRLIQVTGTAFQVFCIQCGIKQWAGTFEGTGIPPVYADLDGEPFKAYYCQECARKLQQEASCE